MWKQNCNGKTLDQRVNREKKGEMLIRMKIESDLILDPFDSIFHESQLYTDGLITSNKNQLQM